MTDTAHFSPRTPTGNRKRRPRASCSGAAEDGAWWVVVVGRPGGRRRGEKVGRREEQAGPEQHQGPWPSTTSASPYQSGQKSRRIVAVTREWFEYEEWGGGAVGEMRRPVELWELKRVTRD